MTDGEEISALKVEVHHLTAAVESLDKKVTALMALANRWKGAFGVLLIIGGMMGSAATFAATKWFR